jgi:hypothetical protein
MLLPHAHILRCLDNNRHGNSERKEFLSIKYMSIVFKVLLD